MNCKFCKGQPYLRSSRRTVLEYLGSTLGVVPVRCRLCRRRNVQIIWAQTGVVAVVLSVSLGCAGFGYKTIKAKTGATRATPAVERTKSHNRATHNVTLSLDTIMMNADIVRLKKAGMGPRVLMRLIETSPTRFRLEPNEIIALKEAGIDDEVIEAMIAAVERSPAPPTNQASVPAAFTAN